MPTISVTWHAQLDAVVCPVCKDLNGYTWIFETSVGTTMSTVGGDLRSFLVHPLHGVVWDVQQGSKAHGHERYNCRCSVSSEIDVSDLRKRIEDLYRVIKVSQL